MQFQFQTLRTLKFLMLDSGTTISEELPVVKSMLPSRLHCGNLFQCYLWSRGVYKQSALFPCITAETTLQSNFIDYEPLWNVLQSKKKM